MRANSHWLGGTGMVLIVSCLLSGCAHHRADEEEEAVSSSSAVAEVTVTQVQQAAVAETIAIGGTVVALPDADVRVSALVAGRIARVPVIEGQSVRRGQLLAELDNRPFRDRLLQAQATLAQAQANLENARANFARNQDLFQRGIAARKEWEAARTDLRVAEAALAQAQAAARLAQLDLDRARITSPIDGVVVRRFLNPGEQVDGTAAQPIVEVARPAPVDLLAEVPAAYLSRLHPGQTLALDSPAFAHQLLVGRVIAVAPAVDPATNVGSVRIRFANADRRLRLGMFVSGRIPIATHPHALVVPPEAIYHDEQGRTIVYRVNGDRATAVAVRTGIETDRWVELTCCVQVGETIIRTGGYGLPDQARIRVQP